MIELNQQSVYFTYLGEDENGIHRVKAEIKISLFGYTKMDMGIAKKRLSPVFLAHFRCNYHEVASLLNAEIRNLVIR